MGFRGNRGDTQGKPYENEHGRPVSMPAKKATGKYKETKLYWVGTGVGFAHSTAWIPGQHNPGRGKGQYFYHVSEGVKERRLHGSAENSGTDPATSEETISEGQAGEGVPILSSL